MNNDLISREALKKAFDEFPIFTEVDHHYARQLIDNAPTVEPKFKPIAEVKFDKEQLQEIVDKAKAEVLASIERPQGKWLTHQTGLLLWEECNQCRAQVGTIGFHYCPNCGADMREADNETN